MVKEKLNNLSDIQKLQSVNLQATHPLLTHFLESQLPNKVRSQHSTFYLVRYTFSKFYIYTRTARGRADVLSARALNLKSDAGQATTYMPRSGES